MEMMLKNKQFSYSSSKWFIKQWRQLLTSTMHVAQELLINIQHSGGSRSFAKEVTALKMRSIVVIYWKLTATYWEDHRSWASTFLESFLIWSKLEMWKRLISGCLVSWLQIKEVVILKCHLLLFCAATKIGLWHAMKSGFYTTGNNQLSHQTKKKLQVPSQS